MRISNYRAVGLSCVALTIASLFSAAGGAQAQSGVLRLGQHQNLTGTNWTFSSDDNNIEGQGGDRASSLRNESTVAWVVYQHDTFRGRRYCINVGVTIPDLHAAEFSYGDAISSVQRLNTQSCVGFPAFTEREF